jgi:hypothetical protein
MPFPQVGAGNLLGDASPEGVAPLMLTALFAALLVPAATTAFAAAPDAGRLADPITGVRSITTATSAVAPECLTADTKGRVTVASLCFREGEDHSWTIEAAPMMPGSYLVRRGDGCLTLDGSRTPHLSRQLCMRDGLGQIWQITQRAPGEYQLAQGQACVTARTGEVDATACRTSRDALGRDDSGQAWKIQRDPKSVVPDPTFGGGTGGS